MATALLMKTKGSPACEAASRALRDAGVRIVEVDDWRQAADELRKSEAALVVCERDNELPRDVARSLSHDLRTPLSAMAGWLHLLESGTLDAAGTKRAIAKLRGNIDEQVRTIERYLGATSEGSRS
jgi:signal transduction histidine kinase